MGSPYICAACGGSFENSDDWTTEKRMEEAKDNGFGLDYMQGSFVRVCDTCYRKIMAAWNLEIKEN